MLNCYESTEMTFDEVFHRCLDGLSKRKGRRILRISEPFAWILETHTWDAEGRELTRVLKRALSRCGGEVLGVEHLPKKFVTQVLLNGDGFNVLIL